MTDLYTKTGSDHVRVGAGNDDAVCVRTRGRYTAIVLADGVSTCKNAAKGAGVVCEALSGLLLLRGEYLMRQTEASAARLILAHLTDALKEESEISGAAYKSLSSTAAAVLYDEKTDEMLLFSLGDSLITARKPGRIAILAQPFDSSEGTPVTTTEGAESFAFCEKISAKDIGGVWIFSDGAWHALYDRARMSDEAQNAFWEDDDEKLKSFLENARTSDDASFVSLRKTIRQGYL